MVEVPDIFEYYISLNEAKSTDIAVATSSIFNEMQAYRMPKIFGNLTLIAHKVRFEEQHSYNARSGKGNSFFWRKNYK